MPRSASLPCGSLAKDVFVLSPVAARRKLYGHPNPISNRPTERVDLKELKTVHPEQCYAPRAGPCRGVSNWERGDDLVC